MTTPPREISSCSPGIAFWVTQVGWQFISTLILGGKICFWAKNYIEKVLECHFWGKGPFSRSMRGIYQKLQRYVRGQNRGFWGWQTQLDHSQVYSMCISHVYTCIHVYAREIHVLHTWEWSSCVCYPQEPPLWPLTSPLSDNSIKS